MVTFGDRLRAARLVQGKTQEHVAVEVGVTKATVSSWENNRDTPSFQYLAPLRMSVGASLDQLVCDDIAKAKGLARAVGVRDERGTYGLDDVGRAKDSRELAVLIRFRALPETRQRALLDFMKPDREER